MFSNLCNKRQENITMRDIIRVEIRDIEVEILIDKINRDARANSIRTEKGIINDLLTELSKNDVFYDIGANIGTHSLFASKIVSSGEIHAFEPHSVNYEVLKDNIKLNKADIQTHKFGLFNEEKEIGFNSISETTAEGKAHIDSDEEINIQVKRTDELKIPNPDVVKIDVEGAEKRVLEGMENIISDCRAIYIEAHPERMIERFNNSMSDITDIVKYNNRSIDILYSRGEETFIKIE